jgi:ABC-type glycerol-3-phosphate transport system permease component
VTWLIVAGVFVLFFALPVVWMLLATTKTDSQIIRGHPFAVGTWHDFEQAWDNLLNFQDGAIILWMKNSAIYAFGSLVITLVTAIPAGYGLALTQFVGRKLLLTTTLVVMIMPQAALVLPLYLEVDPLSLELHGGVDTFVATVTEQFSSFVGRDDIAAGRALRPIDQFAGFVAAIPTASYTDALLVP